MSRAIPADYAAALAERDTKLSEGMIYGIAADIEKGSTQIVEIQEALAEHDVKVVEAAERLFISELQGKLSAGVPAVTAAIVERVQQAVKEEATTCPLCRHEWTRHDPEDGVCDAGPPCECGRSIAWMHKRIAELSRDSLAAASPARLPDRQVSQQAGAPGEGK